ncbi:MAG TPA: FKBP-type peptidyl-prolyl cis-trans isomerase [Desulfomonilaceae bacterium]|nr:FKBP-type peptidyl-prolyl cis-trans isomerase [Desulfomonilaceae bacterium]
MKSRFFIVTACSACLMLLAVTSTNAERTAMTPGGVKIEIVKEGQGPMPKNGQTLVVHYIGTLPDGTKFDSSRDRGQPFPFVLGAGKVIRGWDEAFAAMKVGTRAIITIPPALAYGPRGAGKVIPPNATLIFDVELLEAR